MTFEALSMLTNMGKVLSGNRGYVSNQPSETGISLDELATPGYAT